MATTTAAAVPATRRKVRVEAKGIAEPLRGENHGCCAMSVKDELTDREIVRGAGYVGVVADGWEADYIALIKVLRFLNERQMDGATVVIGQKVIVANHIASRSCADRFLHFLVEVLELIDATGTEVVWEAGTRDNQASSYAQDCFRKVRAGQMEISPFQPKYGRKGF